MPVKKILPAILVIIAVTILSFPYDSVVRSLMRRRAPFVRYESLSASPWSGVRLKAVRVLISGTSCLQMADVNLNLAGIFPLKYGLEISQGAGRISARFWGKPEHLNFEAGVTNFPLHECLPQTFQGIEASANTRMAGAMDLKQKTLLDGTLISSDLGGRLSETSRWAFVFGKTIPEAHFEMEMRAGDLELEKIHMKSDVVSFDGTGALRPAFPLKAATLFLKGDGMIGSRPVSIDKSIPLAQILSSE